MLRKRIGALLLAMLLLFLPCSVAADAAAPDLVVTALSWTGEDGQVEPGTVLYFSVTVKNEGTAAASGPFTVDIGFGTEPLFRLTHTAGLAVGSEITLTSPAWTAAAGDRMVTARVNSTGTVAEAEEWDNDTLQRNLRIGTDRYLPAYDAVRETVAEAGMFDLTFNEDFNDVAAFDAGATGDEGYKWYIRRHAAFPNLKPAEYRTENGILTMDCAIDTFAIGASTIDRVTGIGYTFTHGYLEFRLRMPVAGGEDESKTAIWSFPRERYTELTDYDTHVEMDWLEYYGNNYYTVTLHEMTYEGSRLNWYSSDRGYFDGLGDQQWHTMGYLWEEGSLRCYLDGRLFHTQTWGPDEMPIPMNVVKQGDIKFDGVFSYADTQDMMLFIFGSSKIPLELDYVRIWQHGGKAPAAEPAPTTTVTQTTASATATTTTTAATTVTTATAMQPTTTVTTVPTKATATVTTTAPATTESEKQSTATTAVSATATTEATLTTTATRGTSAAVAQAGSDFGWMIAIGVCVLLIAAAGTAVWWFKKKR